MRLTRRKFIKTIAAAAAIPSVVPAPLPLAVAGEPLDVFIADAGTPFPALDEAPGPGWIRVEGVRIEGEW